MNSTKIMKGLYIIGLFLSALVGIWHFTVPYLYQWNSYIPNKYRNLTVSIIYVNFCFSLLLTGHSFMLLYFRKRIFIGNKECLIMYGFLVFVWLCRVVITFIIPLPLEPSAWVAYGQQIGAIVIFLLQLIPFVYFTRKIK